MGRHLTKGIKKKRRRWNKERVEFDIIRLFDEGKPLNSLHAKIIIAHYIRQHTDIMALGEKH